MFFLFATLVLFCRKVAVINGFSDPGTFRKGCNRFLSDCNVDLAIFVSGGDFSSILEPEHYPAVMEHRYQFDHLYPDSGVKLSKFSVLGYDHP